MLINVDNKIMSLYVEHTVLMNRAIENGEKELASVILKNRMNLADNAFQKEVDRMERSR